MKKSRFTERQIVGVLKEAEAGAKTSDLCRKHGISPATFYTWKSKFDGMEVTDVVKIVRAWPSLRSDFPLSCVLRCEAAAADQSGVDVPRGYLKRKKQRLRVEWPDVMLARKFAERRSVASRRLGRRGGD